MDAYKLHVKIGQAEFNAEGSEETVRQDYDKFLSALSATHTSARSQEQSSRDNGPDGSEASGIDNFSLHRAFRKDRRGIVSLRVRPNTPNRIADSLLMILYGFRILRGQDDVPVIQLMEAAKQSGAQVERIDRAIAPHKDLVTRGGAKRGGRYGLNNPGVARAEELLRQMFQ